MPKFLTIFPYAQNVHLIKDVGMVPYFLYKNHGYDATLASYNNGEYPYIHSEVKGLNHVFIKRITGISTVDIFIFIFLNFRKYDILQCYHFGTRSLLILSFFKILKNISFSKSFTFLKLDAVDEIKKTKLNFVSKFFTKKIDLITVETKGILTYLNDKNILGRAVEYIPNGFYDKTAPQTVSFESKRNLIITVGRIGSTVKNNEVLLEAFKEFSGANKDWYLEIIGPIEPGFNAYIENYFKNNPELTSRVSFLGLIEDRTLLALKYKEAKIFVLSSLNEGFALVYLEAMQFGCSIISTAITPAFDVTDNERFGGLFPVGDVKALVQQFNLAIQNPDKLKADCNLIQKFAYDNYSWSSISVRINKLIKI